MSNMDDIELIEQYLSNQLSPQQGQAFELRLSQDEQFNKLYKEERSIYAAVGDTEAQDFMQSVQDVVSSKSDEVKTFQIFDKRLIAIAASVLILLTASLLFRQSTDKDVMGEFFSPYPIVQVERGEPDNNWVTFAEAYDKQNWNEVINLGATMSEPNAKLYVAMAHISTGNYNQAIEELMVVQSTSADYGQLAQYYMSLSYIGKDDLDAAEGLLDTLIEQLSENDPLRKKASSLIEAIQ